MKDVINVLLFLLILSVFVVIAYIIAFNIGYVRPGGLLMMGGIYGSYYLVYKYKLQEKFSFKLPKIKTPKKNTKPNGFSFVEYVSKRPKNILMSILIISIIKLIIHYNFFPSERLVQQSDRNCRLYNLPKDCFLMENYDFNEHLKYMFGLEPHLFIVVAVVYLIIVFYFSDKIKAK